MDRTRVKGEFYAERVTESNQKGYSGWCGYRLKKENGVWKIEVKQVNLLDSDQGHENLTFTL